MIIEAFRATSRGKDPDGALVTATKCGDMHAFEQLVARHEGRALTTAQQITRTREEAEDVAQESFLKASVILQVSKKVPVFELADIDSRE